MVRAQIHKQSQANQLPNQIKHTTINLPELLLPEMHTYRVEAEPIVKMQVKKVFVVVLLYRVKSPGKGAGTAAKQKLTYLTWNGFSCKRLFFEILYYENNGYNMAN